MSVTHELKIHPEYFRDAQLRRKNFEIRKDDRRFCVGDTLLLREFDPAFKLYTGRTCIRTVDYILRDAENFGLVHGFVCMGLEVDS